MKNIVEKIEKLLLAYKNGELGNTTMPEDTHPEFESDELRISYYSLPMALNYQRDSFKLWEAAKTTYEDDKDIFVLESINKMSEEELRARLLKYKLALQPNKHINTWKRISTTVYDNWGSFDGLIKDVDNDFLKLKEIVQVEHKIGFPYLSGPKIFNYWSYILTEYCDVELVNRDMIEIAPDTHVIQASIRLGVLTPEEGEVLSKDEISSRWRGILKGSGIDPIDVHSPLWFWSRSDFSYKL